MDKDPEYLLLKRVVGWLPEDDWETILGAVVKNPWSPTDNSTPDNPLRYKDPRTKLIETKFEDFVLRKDAVRSNSFELEVKHLGKLRWAKSDGNNLDMQGKIIYVKRLRQQEQFWERLSSKDQKAMEKVTAWLKEKTVLQSSRNVVCLVVGLLICADVIVAETDEEARALVAGGAAALGTVVDIIAASQGILVSTGGTGNTSAQATKKTVNKTYFEATGKEKYIFALELKIIKLKGGHPSLTDNKPKAPSGRQLGVSDEKLEDLELRNIEPQDWEMLLQE